MLRGIVAFLIAAFVANAAYAQVIEGSTGNLQVTGIPQVNYKLTLRGAPAGSTCKWLRDNTTQVSTSCSTYTPITADGGHTLNVVVTTAGKSISTALAISGTPASTASTSSSYSFTPSASGGAGGDVFSETGTLPPGLTFNTGTGAITGTPSTIGVYGGLGISVRDSVGASASLPANPFTITVSSFAAPSSSPNFDVLGDSRMDFAQGAAGPYSNCISSCTTNTQVLTVGQQISKNVATWIPIFNQAVNYTPWFDMARSSATSAHTAAGYNTPGNQCADNSQTTVLNAQNGDCFVASANFDVATTIVAYTPPVSTLCFTASTTGSTGNMAANWVVLGPPANFFPGTTVNTVLGAGQGGCANGGVTLNTPITGGSSLPINSLLWFFPSVQVSGYATHSGTGTNGATRDPDLHTSTFGTAENGGTGYSPCNSPSNFEVILTGVNDSALAGLSPLPLTTLQNVANLVDNLQACSTPKFSIVVDGFPGGLAQANAEPLTSSSGTSSTPIEGALMWDVQQVWVSPPTTSGSPNTLAANDGKKLVSCLDHSSFNTPHGSGTCSPGTGEYSVNLATGVITTDTSTDNWTALSVDYRWTNNALTPNDVDFNAWANDSTSCSNSWNAPSVGNGGSGATGVAINGLQCGRPYVKVVQCYEAMVDNGTGSHTANSLPYMLPDGRHPGTYGGAVCGKLIATAIAAYIGTTPVFPAPTTNSPLIDTQLSTQAGTVSLTCESGSVTNPVPFTSLIPAKVGATLDHGLYVAGSHILMNNAGSFGVVNGDLIDCVDTTTPITGRGTGALHLATSVNTSTGTINGNIVQNDTNNLIGGGQFSHLASQIINTAITGCGTSNVDCGVTQFNASTGSQHFGGICVSSCPTTTKGWPEGWTFTFNTSEQNEVPNGNLSVNYGVETNPESDGFDDFALSVSGQTGHSGHAGQTTSIILTQNVLATTKSKYVTSNCGTLYSPSCTRVRAVCDVQVDYGPNGRLSNLIGIQVAASANSSAGWSAPGSRHSGTTIYTSWLAVAGKGTAGATGAGGNGFPFSDQDVASGPVKLHLVSNWVDLSLLTLNVLSIQITYQAGQGTTGVSAPWPAVSFSSRLRQCELEMTTQ